MDTIIPAIGQGAELNFIPPSSGIETGRTYVKVNDKLQTKNAKVWVGGDVVTGPAMVIDAIKAGQDVAKAIDDGYKS